MLRLSFHEHSAAQCFYRTNFNNSNECKQLRPKEWRNFTINKNGGTSRDLCAFKTTFTEIIDSFTLWSPAAFGDFRKKNA